MQFEKVLQVPSTQKKTPVEEQFRHVTFLLKKFKFRHKIFLRGKLKKIERKSKRK